MKCDVIVLGAGMVGVSTAIYLQRAGLAVTLVDRRGAGEETSHGNAGIIQREGVHPYLFPRDPLKLIAYALNSRVEANHHWRGLGEVAPFLWRYLRSSNRAGARRTYEANIPLFAQCLTTHGDLAKAAGSDNLIARGGWIKVFRKPASLNGMASQLADLMALGLDAATITGGQLEVLEPHLDQRQLAGAIHYRDPWTVSDPGALVKSYGRLFEREGGSFAMGDAMSAEKGGAGWQVVCDEGVVEAANLVVALGPWSKAFLAKFGVFAPLGVKRGYHQHFKAAGEAFLRRPIVDDDNGFVLAPMARGIRLTSGAEFAPHGAVPTPVQIGKALPLARHLFALGDTVDEKAWTGARPVMPDMLPVVGPAPGLAGAWLNFGHAHHGFTLGPATGLLLSQLIAGRTPYADPQPYSLARFRQ